MSTANVQIASYPIPGGDIPCRNLQSDDIPANTIVVVDATDTIDNSGTSGHSGFAVKLPSEGGDPTLSLGVTMENLVAGGQAGRVRIAGVGVAKANGVITAGGTVDASPDSGKAGQLKAHTSGKASIGFALATAADGDYIPFLVVPSLNA